MVTVPINHPPESPEASLPEEPTPPESIASDGDLPTSGESAIAMQASADLDLFG